MKKILSWIPLFSIYIMALALFKVYVFYNNFGIPIRYFINVSELTVNIFEDLLYIFPPLIFLYMLTDKTDSKIETNEIKDKIKVSLFIKFKGKSFKEAIRLLIKKGFIWIAFIFYGLFFLGFPLFLIIHNSNYSEKIAGFAFLGFIILIFIFITKSKRIIDALTIDGMIISTILLLLTFFFVIKVLADIQDTENGKFVGTKVITEDTTYISTLDNYYIGQTTTYIFLFDKKQNKSTIIPSSKIKRIELSIKK